MDKVLKMCELCGKKITGRSDKKFCDDYCRNQFNNARNLKETLRVKQINTILKKNRKIMSSLLGPEEKQKIPGEKMRLLNYDFNFHTHLHHTRNGKTYYFCYEYGYLLLDNDMVLLVRREP